MAFHLAEALAKIIFSTTTFTMYDPKIPSWYTLVMQWYAYSTAEADEGGVEATWEAGILDLANAGLILGWRLIFKHGWLGEGNVNFDSLDSMFYGAAGDR